MRHHGWELPLHPLQVVAVAIFLALVFAFYVFFVPFVGSRVLQLLLIGSYSPTVALVFVLYIWCVATDPADIRVMSAEANDVLSRAKSKSVSSVTLGNDINTGESQLSGHLQSIHSVNQKTDEAHSSNFDNKQLAFCGGFFTHKSRRDLPSIEDGMLYCSVCKVEISKFSKHCRVCDKCVDGFDHHCRWLNNCVGKKNYMGFVMLMVSTILMLIMQWAVGLWVLVHNFLDLQRFKIVIGLELGSSFSCLAYILVVGVCTLLAMAATYPLTHLFCFHIVLIKKGITTYDYIVAMRERGAAQIKVEGESVQTPLTSPTSSAAAANSGASSPAADLQLQDWCTPSRIFFDDEQAGIDPPESYLRMQQKIEPGISPSVEKNLKRKTPVNMSPWAVASLKKEEVERAATIARNKSSILRPVAPIREKMVLGEADSSFDSSRDISLEFIASLGERSLSTKRPELNLNSKDHSPVIRLWPQTGKFPIDSSETQPDSSGNDSGRHLNPLQMEARKVFKSSHAFSASGIIGAVSSRSDQSNGASSESRPDRVLPHPAVVAADWPSIAKVESGGYDASSDESSGSKKIAKKLQGRSPKNKFRS